MTRRKLLGFSALALALGGCEDSGSVVQPAPKRASAAAEEKLGAAFASIAEADANAKPREVKPGDLPPVSLTDRPVDF